MTQESVKFASDWLLIKKSKQTEFSPILGLPVTTGLVVKNPPVNAGNIRDSDSIPASGKSPREGHGKPTPVFLPGESHGQRSSAGCNPSVQFSSVQLLSCVRLCNPVNRSTPGLPVHHQLPEFTQTHVHRVGDAIHKYLQIDSVSELIHNFEH